MICTTKSINYVKFKKREYNDANSKLECNNNTLETSGMYVCMYIKTVSAKFEDKNLL